jgi:hypothetical protein
MGKLIKNHWGRLIIMSAACYQIGAAVEGFFWPKIFWDIFTKTLDPAVKPFPILQIVNLVFGIFMLCLEWPLSFIAGSAIHRSLEFRLSILPLFALAASLLYQATNPAIWYTIGMIIYFVAYSEGEVGCFSSICPSQKISANKIPYRLFVRSLGPCRRAAALATPWRHKTSDLRDRVL